MRTILVLAAGFAAVAAPATAAPEMVPATGYRSFAGKCVVVPAGSNSQAGLLAGLAGIFVPKLAGAAIDAAGRALDAAAADKQAEVSVVVPLDRMPECISIARGVDYDRATGVHNGNVKQVLEGGQIVFEIYLRPSGDGKAVSVQPTWLIYRAPIGSQGSKSATRSLAATITFERPGETQPKSVTLPLGEYQPGEQSHIFDPVRGWPERQDERVYGTYSTGAAASIWFATPFQRRAPAGGQNTGGGSGVAAIRNPTPVPAERLIRISAGQPGLGSPNPPASTGSTGSATTSTAGGQGQGSTTQKAEISIGDPIQPVSVTIKLTELTPGNKVAKFLAPIVKGSKDEVVALVDNMVDPEKIAKAEKAKIDTYNSNSDAFATAMTTYWTTMQAYCAPSLTDKAAIRVKAAELYGVQVKAARAAALVDQTPPFTALVDPMTDNKSSCPAA